MNKNESKYFYTALLMDEALLSLLEQKDYEFITVKEICSKAGVSRSTFYLHYISIDDLLEETVKMVSKKFHDSFNKPSKQDELISNVLTTEKYLKPYLSFIKDNLKIYRLFHTQKNLFKIDLISKELYYSIFDNALSNFGVQEKEKKYIFNFYLEGTLGIIKTWIDNNCNDDIDFIISLIEKNTNLINEKNKRNN